MMCDRCGSRIVGEPDVYDHMAASGPGITLHFHPGSCPSSRQQRTPDRMPVVLSDPLGSVPPVRRRPSGK